MNKKYPGDRVYWMLQYWSELIVSTRGLASTYQTSNKSEFPFFFSIGPKVITSYKTFFVRS